MLGGGGGGGCVSPVTKLPSPPLVCKGNSSMSQLPIFKVVSLFLPSSKPCSYLGQGGAYGKKRMRKETICEDCCHCLIVVNCSNNLTTICEDCCHCLIVVNCSNNLTSCKDVCHTSMLELSLQPRSQDFPQSQSIACNGHIYFGF